MTINDFGKYELRGWRARLLHFAQTLPANGFGRKLALLCRKLVLFNGPEIIDARIEQINFRLHMRDNVSERKLLFLPQFFDVAERRLLQEQLSHGKSFVDIGANAGIYTLIAAASGAQVLAIEPNPVVLDRLRFNLAANGLSQQVRILQHGVADVPGAFQLHLDPSNLGGSSLVTAYKGTDLTIQCELLQTLLQQNGITHIDVLKIDIEGAEDKALLPFFETAPTELYPEWLIIENSDAQWQHDLPAMFRNRGYQLSKRTRMNAIWQRIKR